jgi:hypothetical protein
MALRLLLKFFCSLRGLLFKKPAKIRPIGKPQLISNFFYGMLAVDNQSLRFQDDPDWILSSTRERNNAILCCSGTPGKVISNVLKSEL